MAFYERSAREAANRLGWNPTRVVVLGVLLDSAAIGARLAENREVIGHAFPSPVDRMLAWIDDPSAPAPFGWTLATCDPASRAGAWLRPTTLGQRRSPPAYADYADAAVRLRRAASTPMTDRGTGRPARHLRLARWTTTLSSARG